MLINMSIINTLLVFFPQLTFFLLEQINRNINIKYFYEKDFDYDFKTLKNFIRLNQYCIKIYEYKDE